MEEHRSHSVRLEKDPPAGRNLCELGVDVGWWRWGLGCDGAGSGHDANVRFGHRDIQAGEILHGWTSSSNEETDPIRLPGRATDHYSMLKKCGVAGASFD